MYKYCSIIISIVIDIRDIIIDRYGAHGKLYKYKRKEEPKEMNTHLLFIVIYIYRLGFWRAMSWKLDKDGHKRRSPTSIIHSTSMDDFCACFYNNNKNRILASKIIGQINVLFFSGLDKNLNNITQFRAEPKLSLATSRNNMCNAESSIVSSHPWWKAKFPWKMLWFRRLTWLIGGRLDVIVVLVVVADGRNRIVPSPGKLMCKPLNRPAMFNIRRFELNGNAIRQNSRLVFKRFVPETLEMRHLRITQLYLLVVWDSSEVNGITGKSSATVSGPHSSCVVGWSSRQPRTNKSTISPWCRFISLSRP